MRDEAMRKLPVKFQSIADIIGCERMEASVRLVDAQR